MLGEGYRGYSLTYHVAIVTNLQQLTSWCPRPWPAWIEAYSWVCWPHASLAWTWWRRIAAYPATVGQCSCHPVGSPWLMAIDRYVGYRLFSRTRAIYDNRCAIRSNMSHKRKHTNVMHIKRSEIRLSVEWHGSNKSILCILYIINISIWNIYTLYLHDLQFK